MPDLKYYDRVPIPRRNSAPHIGMSQPKEAQTHMITHLSELARLLDDDHLESLLLMICRDSEIVPLLFRKDTYGADPKPEGQLSGRQGDTDYPALFAALNTALWEKGRRLLADAVVPAAAGAGAASSAS